MKIFWQRLAARIDALSLRERAILFVSIAVALIAIADALVFTPRFAEQKALTRQMRERATELDTMRQRLGAGQADNTPAGRLARELVQVRTELQAVDAGIARGLAAGSGARLPQLLERVLRRHDRLTLLGLATLPPPATPRVAALPLQGVQMALRGSYADLTLYVADLEREMPGLRWGELTLRSSGSAVELDLQVFLLGDAS